MKLTEIEKHISPTILRRGQQYRDEGNIIELEEVDEGVYHAEVEGSEIYEVNVRLDAGGHIHSSCDCPFDMDVMCKHEVAVLLEIRAMVAAPKESKPKVKLSDQVSALSKEQLVKLLLEYAHDIREVKQRLDLYFISSTGGNDEDDLKSYVKIIHSYIKQNAERGGFVPYRNVSKAIVGAGMVLEKASEAEENGDILRAARITVCVLHEMVELLQSSDDSSGYIGDRINECLEWINDFSSSEQSLTPTDRKSMFQLLLQATEHPSMGDWEEWQLELLESAIQLVIDEQERQEWEECAQRLGTGADSYFAKKAAVLKYQLIQKFDSKEQADQFIDANKGLEDIRQIAITETISQEDYEGALKLALEGEQQAAARGFPGLVVQWKKKQLEIYKLTNSLEPQRLLTEEFASQGDYSYYRQLKELYSSEEWPSVYTRVMAELEKGKRWSASSTYTKVLIEEKETLRLLQYVIQNPETVVQFYSHLTGQYPNEVYEIFRKQIEQSLAAATNRNAYKNCCQLISVLMKAGGDQTAREIIASARHRYSNRPALMDELDSV